MPFIRNRMEVNVTIYIQTSPNSEIDTGTANYGADRRKMTFLRSCLTLGRFSTTPSLAHFRPELFGSQNTWTPCTLKTSKDKLEAAEVLFSYKADPNFCSLLVGNTWTKNAYFTETNVHRAVVTNHIKFVDLFVSHGADLTIPNAKGSNPLHNICFCGQLDMLKVILRCESNVSIGMALTKGMVILLFVTMKSVVQCIQKWPYSRQ